MDLTLLQKTVILLASLFSLSLGSVARWVNLLQALSHLSLEDLSTTVIRIEYDGPQNEPIPAVVFIIKGTQADPKLVSKLQSLDGISLDDLSTAVVRIAYLGDASETLPPILFAIKGTEVGQERVTGCNRSMIFRQRIFPRPSFAFNSSARKGAYSCQWCSQLAAENWTGSAFGLHRASIAMIW